MTDEKIEVFLQQGEGLEVEFKKSLFKLNKNTFETICAFLNRKGGHLLLGVNDDGSVEGVVDGSVQKIIDSLVTNVNNPQQLNPPYYLSPDVIDFKGKKIIHCYVPESSQVHSTNGKIFDRNEDGDFNITGHSEQVTQLYLRKQSTYSENKIYPYINISGILKKVCSPVFVKWLRMSDPIIPGWRWIMSSYSVLPDYIKGIIKPVKKDIPLPRYYCSEKMRLSKMCYPITRPMQYYALKMWIDMMTEMKFALI